MNTSIVSRTWVHYCVFLLATVISKRTLRDGKALLQLLAALGGMLRTNDAVGAMVVVRLWFLLC